jgi:hypothetical protein
MFLKQMDNYFSLYPLITVEEKIAILKSSFDVHTFTILQHIAIPADKLNDYDFLKQACIERFGEATSASERRLQFKTEKQSDSQTFDQFYEHLVKIATRAFAATRDQKEVDNDILDQFIGGMNSKYKTIKADIAKFPPKDSRDALATAKRLLAAQRYTEATTDDTSTKASTTPTTLVTTYAPGWSRGRSRGYRSTRGVPSSRTPEGRVICYNCGKPNHISAHCPEPPSTSRYSYQRGRGNSSTFRRPYGHQYGSSLPSQSLPPYPSRHEYGSRETSPYPVRASALSSSPRRNDSFPSYRGTPDREYDSRRNTEYEQVPYRNRRDDELWSMRDHDIESSYNSRERGRAQPERSNDSISSRSNQRRQSSTKTRSPQVIGNVNEGESKCMYVRGYVNNVLSYVMIDTGSTVNIVSKKFLDELNAVEPVQLMPHDGNVYGIADDACTVIGTAKLTIVLCNQDDNSTRNTFTAKCLVCDNIRMECLLGLDFLLTYAAKIDLPARSLVLTNNFTTTKHELVKNTYQALPVSVFVVGEHIIQPEFTMLYHLLY